MSPLPGFLFLIASPYFRNCLLRFDPVNFDLLNVRLKIAIQSAISRFKCAMVRIQISKSLFRARFATVRRDSGLLHQPAIAVAGPESLAIATITVKYPGANSF